MYSNGLEQDPPFSNHHMNSAEQPSTKSENATVPGYDQQPQVTSAEVPSVHESMQLPSKATFAKVPAVRD